MLELGIKLLISYLLGSLLGSMVMGRLRGGVDIRKLGSGNAGGTNALRTQGKLFALGVMVVDVGKGVLPVLLLPTLAIPGVGLDAEVSRDWLAYGCGAAAVLGHVFPVWFGFAGGKGGATLIGVVAIIAPKLLLPLIVLWLAIIFISGYVGLATMLTAWSVPTYIGLTQFDSQQGLFVFGTAMAAFVVYTHRSNIQRMLAGTEGRHTGFSLFRGRD